MSLKPAWPAHNYTSLIFLLIPLLQPGMSNFSPRENRFYEISLRECGREILPSKSPNGREKRHSPFKISLGEFKGRFSFQNLLLEERKYFLGRILNLPSKLKNEINFFWLLEVKMAHIIWDIYQIIDIWWAIIGTWLGFKISIQILKIWIF